jgi:hypothetical protein
MVNKIEPYSMRREKNQWWFVETWRDGRELFKALVEHVFAFLLLIGTLILFHYIFKLLDLPPQRKEILESIDFWSIAVALVIFGVSFLYKLVHEAIHTARKKIQAERLLRLQMENLITAKSGLAGEALNEFIDQELFTMEKLAKSR